MKKKFSNKKSLKLVLVFIGTALVTLLLIATIARVHQWFSDTDNNSSDMGGGEVIEKNDDKTISMRYAGYVTVKPEEGLITLYFENPIRSKKTVKLEIIGEINGREVTFAKVDSLLPGEKVESIKYELDEEIESGTYTGKFAMSFYNENGSEEMIKSNVVIDVIVK